MRGGRRSCVHNRVVEPVADLQRRREVEGRLAPDRAIGSLQEAEAFLRDRGLLTRPPDSPLPGLYDACHEDAYQPGSPGFATWPATKWHRFGELAALGPDADPVRAFGDLVGAGVRAAVLAPDSELRRWFSWNWYWTDALLDDLISEGRLRTVGDGLIAAGPAP